MQKAFTISDIHSNSTWCGNENLVGQLARAITPIGTCLTDASGPWSHGRLEILSGPWQGTKLFVNGFRSNGATNKARKSIVCNCSAYPFPHAAFGGSCSGDELVSRAYEGGYCDSCFHADLFQGDANEPASLACRLQEIGSLAFLKGCPMHRRTEGLEGTDK